MTPSIYQTGVYLAKHPTWHVEDSRWKAEQVCRMLNRNGLKPGTICEVGCGAGGVLAELQKRSPDETRLWGYEISAQAVEFCMARQNDRLRFVLADILESPPSHPFELLLLLDVVEHVENHLDFLRNVKRAGKYVLFHFPLDLSAQSILRGVPSKVRDSAGHLHYFTKQLVFQTLRETGYHILDYAYTPASIECPSPGIKTRLMRLPRRLFFALQPDAAALCLGGFSLLVLAA